MMLEDDREDKGYSIAAHCGDDMARQIERADWHLQNAANARMAARLQAGNLRTQAAALIARAEKAEADGERAAEWDERAVQTWAVDHATTKALGNTIQLSRAVVKVRRSAGSVRVNEQAVLAWAARNDDLWGDVVTKKPVVVKEEVRRRFILDGGAVVDKATGEVVEPIAYEDANGVTVSGQILMPGEPPGIKANIEWVEQPKEGV